MAERKRLDIVLVERGLAPTRAKARGMIMAAEVMVDGQVTSKPGMPVSSEAKVELKRKPRFVSRGGEKLAGALADFQLRVENRICADVGASTGGFTDCLLQNGAARVYAIDVGYGQLDYGLRQDDRVVVMERTNARHVEQLSEKVDLVVIDASFISLRLLLPVVKNWLDNEADIITLIKPQFEAGKKDVGKGGVVRDPDIHRRVLSEILTFAVEQSFAVHGLTRSPITGPAGNIEFLAWLGWASESAAPPIEIADLIEAII
ncbi:MAG: TlyA family rRNA (cytidine-2'-O)-methyltransferase [Anaerolineaceae bacterium]|nr:TlyA family rRNA (cytidine-2'-O)-methyltransferase [Anaerolineaceae bacterium]